MPLPVRNDHGACPGLRVGPIGLLPSWRMLRRNFGHGASGANGRSETPSVNASLFPPVSSDGPVHAAIRVESISASFNNTLSPFGDGSATVSYTVHNAGNVRLTGSQAVSVTGPFGLAATASAHGLPTVLPGDSVRITTRAAGLYPAGPLTARVKVSPANPAGAPPLAQRVRLASGSASLFAVPWPLIGLLILLVGGGVGGWQAWRWRRRRLRAALTAVADQARRETEARLLGSSPAPAAQPQGQA